MKHYLEKPDTPGELIHAGVKGMKWGVRKSLPVHSSYSPASRSYDRKKLGTNAVHRINSKLHEGTALSDARAAEYKTRNMNRRKAIVAGTLAVRYRKQIVAGARLAGVALAMTAGVAAQHIAVKAETNRGRAAAANIMGISEKGSSINYAAKKHGAYNISSI